MGEDGNMPKGKHANDSKEVDRSIGLGIRALRISRDVSQERLAAEIGVTFQQVQKYEKGMNRVSGSRMQRIADALGVKPSYFFGETDAITNGAGPIDHILALAASRPAMELLHAFNAMSPSLRHAYLNLGLAITGIA
jgi:transcriptional regulator with XRE-family HTH domain